MNYFTLELFQGQPEQPEKSIGIKNNQTAIGRDP